jgi:hypothetical protein
MFPTINIVREGLFDARQLDSWTKRKRQQLYSGAARAMSVFGKETEAKIRGQVESAFDVKKRAFVTSFRHKVFTNRSGVLPSMVIGSKLPFGGIFERGGTITARGGGLLIPINIGKRIGVKRFRLLVAALMNSGNAFFKKVNGKTLLFAENISENGQQLRRFKSHIRKQRGSRIKRGEEIPIAVLVPRVQVRKRLHVEKTVRQGLPRLLRLIETEAGKQNHGSR